MIKNGSIDSKKNNCYKKVSIMKRFSAFSIYLITFLLLVFTIDGFAERYTLGVGDILQVKIIQPEQFTMDSTVSPGGEISVPYIGSLKVKGKTISQTQKMIQYRLSKGYLKYPVVTVSLLESKSRKFTISGEVIKPGTYTLNEDTTVLKAISMAGGFTKYGSSSKVKILRPKKKGSGYKNIKIDIKAILEGKAEKDILLMPGDIIVVSESMF